MQLISQYVMNVVYLLNKHASVFFLFGFPSVLAKYLKCASLNLNLKGKLANSIRINGRKNLMSCILRNVFITFHLGLTKEEGHFALN